MRDWLYANNPLHVLDAYLNRRRSRTILFGGCLFWIIIWVVLLYWYAFLLALWCAYSTVWVVLLAGAEITHGIKGRKAER